MEPPRKKTIYENIHALRQKPATCKLGLHYSRQSDMEIMQAAERDVPVAEIAKAQKRTPRAIQIRIINIALAIMEQHDDLSLEDISRKYHIKMSLLSRHYQRLCERKHHTLSLIKHAVEIPHKDI